MKHIQNTSILIIIALFSISLISCNNSKTKDSIFIEFFYTNQEGSQQSILVDFNSSDEEIIKHLYDKLTFYESDLSTDKHFPRLTAVNKGTLDLELAPEVKEKLQHVENTYEVTSHVYIFHMSNSSLFTADKLEDKKWKIDLKNKDLSKLKKHAIRQILDMIRNGYNMAAKGQL